MKRTSLRVKLAALVASLLSVGTASGQFVKIDDFESYAVGDLGGQGAWTADPGIEVVIEPDTTNHVFNSLGGAFNAVAVNDDPNLEIADGETTAGGSFLTRSACLTVADGEVTIEMGGQTGFTTLTHVLIEDSHCGESVGKADPLP